MIAKFPVEKLTVEYSDGKVEIYKRPMYFKIERVYDLINFDNMTMTPAFTSKWSLYFESMLREEVNSGKEEE